MDSKQYDSDDDYEEEELIVFVDFQSKITPDALIDPNVNLKLIGIDTESPIMQINSKVFQGTYEYAMGTDVFFCESDIPASGDPNYELVPAKMYDYLKHTNKVLKMNRIFVDRKENVKTEAMTTESSATSQPDDMSDASDEDGPVRLTKSYADVLNQFLQPGEIQPRTLDESDEVFFRKHGWKIDTGESNATTADSGGDLDAADNSRAQDLKSELELARQELHIDDQLDSN